MPVGSKRGRQARVAAHLSRPGVSPRPPPASPKPSGSWAHRAQHRHKRHGSAGPNDARTPVRETPAHARRPADAPAPHPAERGAAPAPSGAAASRRRPQLAQGPRAPPLLSGCRPSDPLRLAGRAAGTRPASLGLGRRGAERAPNRLCAAPRARARARGGEWVEGGRSLPPPPPPPQVSALPELMAAASFLRPAPPPPPPLLPPAAFSPRAEHAGCEVWAQTRTLRLLTSVPLQPLIESAERFPCILTIGTFPEPCDSGKRRLKKSPHPFVSLEGFSARNHLSPCDLDIVHL